MPRIWRRYSRYPCCATFFVKTKQIRKRSKEEYIKIFQNLLEWIKYNKDMQFYCSRLFEFTWHILFTNNYEIPLPPYSVKWYKKRTKTINNICEFKRTD